MGNFFSDSSNDQGTARMDFFDLANLLDNDGNLQNEMMVMSFAATMLATIPVLLGNEFDVNVGLRKKREAKEEQRLLTNGLTDVKTNNNHENKHFQRIVKPVSRKFYYADKLLKKLR